MIKVIFSNDWHHLPLNKLKETLYSIQTYKSIKMKKLPILILIVIFSTTASFTLFQTKPWNVPADKAKLANAVKSDATSIAAGKVLIGFFAIYVHSLVRPQHAC